MLISNFGSRIIEKSLFFITGRVTTKRMERRHALVLQEINLITLNVTSNHK